MERYGKEALKEYAWVFLATLIVGAVIAAAFQPKPTAYLGYVAGFVIFTINVFLIAWLSKQMFMRVTGDGDKYPGKPVSPVVLGFFGFLKVILVLGALYVSIGVLEFHALFIGAGCLAALTCFALVGALLHLKPGAV